MPVIVIASILKNIRNNKKVNLYEKSHIKSAFLKDVSRKLELNTEIFQQNIFDLKKIET